MVTNMGNKCLPLSRAGFDLTPTMAKSNSNVSGGSITFDEGVLSDPGDALTWSDAESWRNPLSTLNSNVTLSQSKITPNQRSKPRSVSFDDNLVMFGISREFSESVGKNFRTKRSRTLEELGLAGT